MSETNICGDIPNIGGTSCLCCLIKEHTGDHLCTCNGSWYYDEQGKFVPTAFPNGVKITGDLFTDLANLLGIDLDSYE